MAKATKTWKIGEYCQGGVITVEITGKVIAIIGKDWDTSTGYRKSSNQSNAKEFTRGTVTADDSQAYRKMYDFLSSIKPKRLCNALNFVSIEGVAEPNKVKAL